MLDARQSDGRPRRLGPNPGRLASSARTPNRLAGSAAHMASHVAPHGVHVFSTRPRRPQMLLYRLQVEPPGLVHGPLLVLMFVWSRTAVISCMRNARLVIILSYRNSHIECKILPIPHLSTKIRQVDQYATLVGTDECP